MSSAWLATWLDVQMLLDKVGGLPGPGTPDAMLPTWTGPDLADLLGDRRLCRYVTAAQIGAYVGGSTNGHWVTPTPYSPDDLSSYLFLPNPSTPRSHVLLLDPKPIVAALGPRQVHAAPGIEFLLPQGFPGAAVVDRWEMEVR